MNSIIELNTKLKKIEKQNKLYRKINPNVATYILVYTPDEFQEIKKLFW
ncbi:MAG: hypothetical protein ACPLWB_05815 [Caldisericia bacterium]